MDLPDLVDLLAPLGLPDPLDLPDRSDPLDLPYLSDLEVLPAPRR